MQELPRLRSILIVGATTGLLAVASPALADVLTETVPLNRSIGPNDNPFRGP